MSVAAATGAVSTQHHHQATAEQIRLAQLIDDKKHDHPDVQDIVRRVLDVVADSTQEEALVALYDCDYDYEKAVALLIDKGHDIASEWRTATNHKTTKKQQKTALVKNGHGGETDENGHSRNNDGFTQRGKSRTGRSRFPQQQNGGDSQQNSQQNDSYTPQQRQRGGSNNYHGRFRGNNRGGGGGGSQRTNDRNYQQQQVQDSNNLDVSSPSDTTQRSTDVPYNNNNRRDGGVSSNNNNNAGGNGKQQESQPWDVGNWNGETLVYSRSSKDDEKTTNVVNNNVSNTSHNLSEVPNNQYPSLKNSTVNNVSELNTQQQSKSNFDPMEAARQIKNVIGIGQTQPQQQQKIPPTKPLMGNQQQKPNIIPSKSTGQNFQTKVTPPLPTSQTSGPQRIPLQPVIFSDRFDGGMNKIDVQFGNLNETFDDTSVSIPPSSSAFYPTSGIKNNDSVPLGQSAQRSTEQSAFVSPTTQTNATRSIEQQAPVMNQARVLSQQIPQQQQSMTMKPIVPQPYPVHHQQHAINPQNILLHPLLLHPQQQESVALDASFDPAFQMPSIDFNSQYFMAMNQQSQPAQARFLLSQPPHQTQQSQQQQQQNASNRQAPSGNVQTSSLSNSSSAVPPSSTSTTTSTAPKKGPAIPPGMFPNMAQPAYSTNYGVPLSVGRQQQTGAAAYSYDGEHLFTNPFMQLTNPQQAQSPSGAYGSVTPPVQQTNQQQQAHANNDNKGLNYPNQFHENLLLLQQFQQIPIPQSNSQSTTHSPAQFNYILGHAGNGPSYSPAPSILFAQPPAAMAQHQQQAAKQQYNHANSSSSSGIGGNEDYYGRNSSSSTKEVQYMYGQGQQVSSQSTGKQQNQQQQQQQQRNSGNVYNNQTNSQRSYQ